MMKVYFFNFCFFNNKKFKEKLNKFNLIFRLIFLGDINSCIYICLRIVNFLLLNINGFRYVGKKEYFYEYIFIFFFE